MNRAIADVRLFHEQISRKASNGSIASIAEVTKDDAIEISPWREPLKAGKLRPRSEAFPGKKSGMCPPPKLSYLTDPSQRASYNLQKKAQVALSNSQIHRLLLEQRGLLPTSDSTSTNQLSPSQYQNRGQTLTKDPMTMPGIISRRCKGSCSILNRDYSFADYDSDTSSIDLGSRQSYLPCHPTMSAWTLYMKDDKIRDSVNKTSTYLSPLAQVPNTFSSSARQLPFLQREPDKDSLLSSDEWESLLTSDDTSTLATRRHSNAVHLTYPVSPSPLESLASCFETKSDIPTSEHLKKTVERRNRELALRLGGANGPTELWCQWLMRYWKGEVSIDSSESAPWTRCCFMEAPVTPFELERLHFFLEIEKLIAKPETLSREHGLNFHLRRLSRTLGYPTMVFLSLFTEDAEVILTCQSRVPELQSLRTIPRSASLGFHVALHCEDRVFTLPDLKSHWLFRYNELAVVFGLRHYVALPLFIEGHIVGLLSTFDKTPRASFEPAHVAAMMQTRRRVLSILCKLRLEVKKSIDEKRMTQAWQGPSHSMAGSMANAVGKSIMGKIFCRSKRKKKRDGKEEITYSDLVRQPLMTGYEC